MRELLLSLLSISQSGASLARTISVGERVGSALRRGFTLRVTIGNHEKP